MALREILAAPGPGPVLRALVVVVMLVVAAAPAIATAAAVAAGATSAGNAGSYIALPQRDITVSHVVPSAGPTVKDTDGYVLPNGSHFSDAILMQMCEASGCSNFNSAGFLKWFPPNATVTSYISNTTCGSDGGDLSIVPGTCLSPPSAHYLRCSGPNNDAFMVPIAHYNLPPFLIQEACDKNPKCAGFKVMNDGSQGWLLQWMPSCRPITGVCGPIYVRLDVI